MYDSLWVTEMGKIVIRWFFVTFLSYNHYCYNVHALQNMKIIQLAVSGMFPTKCLNSHKVCIYSRHVGYHLVFNCYHRYFFLAEMHSIQCDMMFNTVAPDYESVLCLKKIKGLH